MKGFGRDGGERRRRGRREDGSDLCGKKANEINDGECLSSADRKEHGVGCHVKHSSHGKVANPGSLHLKPLCDYSEQSPHRERRGAERRP